MRAGVQAGALAAVLALASVALPSAAQAASGSATGRAGGHVVTVKPARALDAAGQRLVVTGRGFDPRIGIYVGLCVIPERGAKPTPCGGGVNTSGASSASAWVSSNPPPYGQSLAIPFGRRGSFRVVLTVSSAIGDVDCRTTPCAIVTRADHTRPGDRSADVIVPVTFS